MISHNWMKYSRDPSPMALLLVTMASLLGAPGIATRSKDATRGSCPYY